MEYILRVAVHEDAWRRQLGELLELCARTPIREVMLMEESHQLLTSPFPREKHERMAAVYACMAEAFAAAGVRHSVNLVTCAGHGDNRVPARLALPSSALWGRTLRPRTQYTASPMRRGWNIRRRSAPCTRPPGPRG